MLLTPFSLSRFTSALLLAALLGSASVLVGIAPAQAHNVLRSSDPKDGASVPAPAQVTLTFDQSVQTLGTAVQIEGPKGALELAAPTVDGQTVVQPMPERLATGAYTVLWRATSADGHPIDGNLTFTATAATRPPDPTSPPDAPAPTTSQAPTSTPPSATATSGPSTSSPSTESGDAATDDAEPVSADSDAGGPSWPLWLGVGALVVVLAAAGLWLFRRERGPAE